jgi:16S rRNA processing protein RimM
LSAAHNQNHNEDEFITIARVLKPQGRRGEAAAELHTDFPERFAERRELQLLGEKGERRSAELERFRLEKDKGRAILKFRGVESIAEAEKLRGCEVQIRRGQRTELEAGSAYISDLIGCEVFDRGRRLGKIRGVQFGAGEAPLLEVGAHGKELLLPFASAYIVALDTLSKKIELALPEGMLELDAPLSEEEKERQRRQQPAARSQKR